MPQNHPQSLPGESLSLGVSCLLSMQPVSFVQPSVYQDTHGSAKDRLAGNRPQLAESERKTRRRRISGIEIP
ncbi:uncharacterized [Tachysurus ichikawai]